VKISVLMPTRKRPEKCIETISYLVKNADYTSDIEVILACDNDDKSSLDKVLENIGKEYQDLILKYRYFDSKGYEKIHEYFDDIIDLISKDSELLLYLSDDIRVVTKSWDRKLLEFHKDKKFGAYFLDTRTSNEHGRQYITCALPKKWIELTGRSGLVATDSWMEYVAREAGCLYYIDNVECRHTRDYNDETQKRTNISKRSHPSKPLFHSIKMKEERNIDANKIKEYLKTIKGNDNECK